MPNVNAAPLTAPRRLQPGRLRPQPSCQLSGWEHIFQQEAGLSRRPLSQRVCAGAGRQISSLPEESGRFARLKMRKNPRLLRGLAGQIWIQVWVCPPPPPP